MNGVCFGIIAQIETPCVLDAAKWQHLDYQVHQIVQLVINRFIVGAFTAISVGSANIVPALEHAVL